MDANPPAPWLAADLTSTDIDLARRLVRIAGDGLRWPPADGGAELARWAWEVLPAQDRDALTDIWRSMLGLGCRPPSVLRLDGSLSTERALRIVEAVRRRARDAIRNERRSRWRREVPVGDLHGSAA